jgi:hypothetical protein
MPAVRFVLARGLNPGITWRATPCPLAFRGARPGAIRAELVAVDAGRMPPIT